MKTFQDIKKLSRYIRVLKSKGKTIGFVPTMGYLHRGHLSLVKASRKESDITVVSIFVNPTQFGPKEDYKKYPRDFKRDEKLAKRSGVDIIFYPTAKAMYPNGFKTYVNVKDLAKRLCGVSRSGHFQGVATVVLKLFNIVQPDYAYFGQKDAQQAIVIKKMVEDLNMSIKFKVLPIIREPTGLAMSSRNRYLMGKERFDAPVLSLALRKASLLVKGGKRKSSYIKGVIRKEILSKKTARIEYVSIVDTKDLKEVKTIRKGTLIALAVRIGKTRLIDNTIIK